MNKTSLVKWALSAMLAVPAISAFAATSTKAETKYIHHHRHTVLVSSKHHHRKYHHLRSKHSKLTSRHHRHASLSHRSSRPTVSVTHMPPTIDGMGA
jgi:hypothetical protein